MDTSISDNKTATSNTSIVGDANIDVCFQTPLSSNRILSSSANCSTSTSSGAKKSILRKVSRYEDFSAVDGTPKSPKPTQRKRIRILENVEVNSSNKRIQRNGDEDIYGEENSVEKSKIFRTNHFNEEVLWISPSTQPLDFSMVTVNLVKKRRFPVPNEFSVEIDYHFIDSATLTAILKCKDSANEIGAFDYEKWSTKNCPFRDNQNAFSSIFRYESNAMKLANLDAAVDFGITSPKNLNHDKLANPSNSTKEPSVFYFGDIWVNSKGFREYILWKNRNDINTKEILCKGFAIRVFNGATIQNSKCGVIFSSVPHEDKFAKEDLPCMPVEVVADFTSNVTVEQGELDILNLDVSDGFVKFILDGTDGKGVHLLVADNPECFNVNEAVQEVRIRRKLFCQCIIALLAVREGGNFVVKIFDSITEFTVGLIFLIHRCFKSVSIHKPSLGSPSHSSERFLICREKIVNQEALLITQFLLQVREMVTKDEQVTIDENLNVEAMEVKELIPLRLIFSHAYFFEFIRLSNLRLGRQIVLGIDALWPLVTANEIHQSDPQNVREARLQLRTRLGMLPSNKVEDSLKPFCDPQAFVLHLLNGVELCKTENLEDKDFWQCPEKKLSRSNLKEISKNPQNWEVFPVQDIGKGGKFVTRGRGLFVGLGQNKVFYFDGTRWKQVWLNGLELTKGTVFYGEIVDEIISPTTEPDTYPKMNPCCHIFDVAFIHGQHVGALPFHRRQELARSYVLALSKLAAQGDIPCIRVRDSINITELTKLTSRISEKRVTGYKELVKVYEFGNSNDNTERSVNIMAGGLLFWKTYGCRKQQVFLKCMTERLTWKWNEIKNAEHIEKDKKSLISYRDICNLTYLSKI